MHKTRSQLLQRPRRRGALRTGLQKIPSQFSFFVSVTRYQCHRMNVEMKGFYRFLCNYPLRVTTATAMAQGIAGGGLSTRICIEHFIYPAFSDTNIR